MFQSKVVKRNETHILCFVLLFHGPYLFHYLKESDWDRIVTLHVLFLSSSSSVALQPGVGLGLLYNMPPSLSIPCSISPFVYSHLSQVRGHVIQPSHFWSASSSCCIQLSVQHLFWNCGVLHSFYMTKSCIFWHLMNLTMFSPLIITSNSSFRRILNNSFSFTGPYIFCSIFLSNTANALSSSMVSVHDSEPYITTGCTNVRYICNLLLLDTRLLTHTYSHWS